MPSVRDGAVEYADSNSANVLDLSTQCSEWDTQLYLIVRLNLWSFGDFGVSFHYYC